MKLSIPKLSSTALSMMLLFTIFTAGLGIADAAAAKQATNASSSIATIQGDLAAHDPTIIKEGNTYYVFSTGGGLQIRTSTDLVTWTRRGSVFSSIPSWVTSAIGNITDLWAPDIHFVNGTYYLYYAGSTFGSRNSVIGLATNKTLKPSASNYRWVDQGLVIRTTTANNYNAIDPNLSFDANNTPWLAFGSWGTGLKLRRLNASTFKLSSSDTTLYSIANRRGYGSEAIEASYIVHHGSYYYLFASIDLCCHGITSTYKIVVGRSSSITGTYVSQAGVSMLTGGYTILLQRSGNVIGPGGQSIYHDGSRDLLIHHYYDGASNGAVKIQIRTVNWGSNGWPTLSGPIS